MLAFPTSQGNEWELEGAGLIGALADFVDAGRVKIFCVGSNNSDSFMNKGAHPSHRSWRQRLFDEYIRDEVVPFIYAHCASPGIAITTMGASMGAYHAANTLFRYPHLVKRCYALVGDVRSAAADGRRLRRQLLLSQSRRLPRQPERPVVLRAARELRDPARHRDGPVRGKPLHLRAARCCQTKASAITSTTGARWAVTTGPTGKCRCGSISAAGDAQGEAVRADTARPQSPARRRSRRRSDG